VALVGDFHSLAGETIALKPWQRSVEGQRSTGAGTYHYRFLVDGEWRDDPESTLRVPNPFGSENAVRKVG